MRYFFFFVILAYIASLTPYLNILFLSDYIQIYNFIDAFSYLILCTPAGNNIFSNREIHISLIEKCLKKYANCGKTVFIL